jgi:hypothetical protein
MPIFPSFSRWLILVRAVEAATRAIVTTERRCWAKTMGIWCCGIQGIQPYTCEDVLPPAGRATNHGVVLGAGRFKREPGDRLIARMKGHAGGDFGVRLDPFNMVPVILSIREDHDRYRAEHAVEVGVLSRIVSKRAGRE